MNFFDLGLHLASRDHFLFFRPMTMLVSGGGTWRPLRPKSLKSYLYLWGLGVFFVFGASLQLSRLQRSGYPENSSYFGRFMWYLDLRNHDSQRLTPKTKNTPRPHKYKQDFKNFGLRGLLVPPPETSMVIGLKKQKMAHRGQTNARKKKAHKTKGAWN